MRTLASFAFIALAASAPAQAAQKVTEPVTGFEVTFPDGWKTGKLQTVTRPHVVGVFEQDAERAVCIFGADENPNTKGLTQAEMNKTLRTPVGREFWRTQVLNGLSEAAIERDGVREHPSGVVVQEAEATAGGPNEATRSIRLKLIATFIATPGITYNATCSTYPQAFEKYRPAFRAIVDSFRPGKPGLSVSINPPPGSASNAAAAITAAQTPAVASDMFGAVSQDGLKALFTKPEIAQ